MLLKNTRTNGPSGRLHPCPIHPHHSKPFKYSRSLAKVLLRMRTPRGIICTYLTIIHRSGGKYPSTSGPKSNFTCDNIPTKAVLFFFGYSTEVNSTLLITSELANQHARKVLFTCVVYTKIGQQIKL